MRSMSPNVVAMPTAPDGSQGWRCTICGKHFSYSQPIGFGLQLAMLFAFGSAHLHDGPTPPEPALNSLDGILAHAQQCQQDAAYLDAGRTEHAQLAADVQRLVHLVEDIRRAAASTSPNCINLAGIDRLITKATAQ